MLPLRIVFKRRIQVGLQIRSRLRHTRPMRRLTRLNDGGALRWRKMAVFGLLVWIDVVAVRSQTVEHDPAPSLLSLGGDLILAGTSSVAQSEPYEELPLPPSEFNPDPGASQRLEPEAPPELFPPVLPQLPQYGEEPLPRSLQLPRKGVREVVPQRRKLG